jgi:phosphonatase-like hydrolase
MPVKLAVFDIAGTTVEDRKAVFTAFKRCFDAKGFAITEEIINPLMGYKKPDAIKKVLEFIGIYEDDGIVDEIHNCFINEMKEYYEFSPDVKAMPGAEETMYQLKEKGIRIALNTGFSKEIADAVLRRMQWLEMGLVDDYIGSDEVPEGRPDPAMINKLMDRAGMNDPKEVIKIGDTEADVNEGRNAGCLLVISVTTGAFTKTQLEQFGPDHILDNLSELPAIISLYE